MIDFDRGVHKVWAVRKYFGRYQIKRLIVCEPVLDKTVKDDIRFKGGLFANLRLPEIMFFVPISEIRRNFFEEKGEADLRYQELMRPVLKRYRQGTNEELSLVSTEEIKRVTTTLPVGEYTEEGKCIKIYSSMKAAAKEKKISIWWILNMAEGYVPEGNGTRWKYMCETMPEKFKSTKTKGAAKAERA